MRAVVAVVPTIRHAAPVVRLPWGCAFPFPLGPKYYVKGFAIFNDWVPDLDFWGECFLSFPFDMSTSLLVLGLEPADCIEP